MDHFILKDGVMHAENVPLPRIAAEVGTPVYVYSRATLERHAQVFREALADVPDKLIAFAVKSNPNLAVLKVLGAQGMGADVIGAVEVGAAHLGPARARLVGGLHGDAPSWTGASGTSPWGSAAAPPRTAAPGSCGVSARW